MGILLQNQLELYYYPNRFVQVHIKKKYICKLNLRNEENNRNNWRVIIGV
jgi:hypothetical protein